MLCTWLAHHNMAGQGLCVKRVWMSEHAENQGTAKASKLQTVGLDHGVGHFRPLSITRQRHLLAYHGIAMSCEGLCQVFWQFFVTTTHCILITYKCAFISMAYKKSKKIK